MTDETMKPPETPATETNPPENPPEIPAAKPEGLPPVDPDYTAKRLAARGKPK